MLQKAMPSSLSSRNRKEQDYSYQCPVLPCGGHWDVSPLMDGLSQLLGVPVAENSPLSAPWLLVSVAEGRFALQGQPTSSD